MSPEPVPAPVDNSSEATMLGPVPLVPLGRPSVAAAARLVEHGLRHPLRVAQGGLQMTGELAAVARGTSTRAPEKGDRRFADPAFVQSPVYRRLAQGYLAATAVADDTVGRLGLDPKSEGRARFVVGQVADALAPTNRLTGNPAALRKAKATRGKSLPGRGPQPGRRRAPQRGHAEHRRLPALRRGRDHGRDPRGRGLPRRRGRADPVPAGHTPGVVAAGGLRPARDQPPLHPRPVTRPKPGRTPPEPGPPGVRAQLAQPDQGRGGLEPRHLRRHRRGRRSPPPAASPTAPTSTWSPPAPAGSPPWPWPVTWPPPATAASTT